MNKGIYDFCDCCQDVIDVCEESLNEENFTNCPFRGCNIDKIENLEDLESFDCKKYKKNRSFFKKLMKAKSK